MKRAAELPLRAALAAPAGDGDGGGATLMQIAEVQERVRRQGELLEALHNQTAGQAPRNPAQEAPTHTTPPQKKKGRRRKKKRGGAGAGIVATPADGVVARVSDDAGAALIHRRSPPSPLSGSSRPRGEADRITVEGGAEGKARGKREESDEQVLAVTWR